MQRTWPESLGIWKEQVDALMRALLVNFSRLCDQVV